MGKRELFILDASPYQNHKKNIGASFELPEIFDFIPENTERSPSEYNAPWNEKLLNEDKDEAPFNYLLKHIAVNVLKRCDTAENLGHI